MAAFHLIMYWVSKGVAAELIAMFAVKSLLQGPSRPPARLPLALSIVSDSSYGVGRRFRPRAGQLQQRAHISADFLPDSVRGYVQYTQNAG